MVLLTREEADAERDKHTDPEALRRIDSLIAFNQLYLRTLERQAFLDLAWLENDETRYLTADEPSRTLEAVAEGIVRRFGRDRPFAELLRAAPIPGKFRPAWFDSCARIERDGFDVEKMDRPWLVPARPNERRGCERTDFYICEGLHSTIALAVELVGKGRTWRGLEAIVSGERGPEC
jgi:hypothetical protein